MYHPLSLDIRVFVNMVSLTVPSYGQFYTLVEPTDALFFVVICDSRVEDDAVFGAEDLDFWGRVCC